MLQKFRRWLIPIVGALVLVGVSPAIANAAVTGTVGTATVLSQNGSDFKWTCDVNPGGATIWVTGRSWWDPSDPINHPAVDQGVDGMSSTNNRTQLTGSTTQTLTFTRNGDENQAYAGRCLWYTSATTGTVLGKTSGTFTVTTSIDNDPPVASISGPGTVQVGTAATFSSAGSTDPDNNIVNYRWDFGDGSAQVTDPATSQDHTFTTAGTYSVAVAAVDAGGLESTVWTSITVTNAPVAPVASVTASPLTVVEDSGTVTADASGSTDADGDIATYTFNWGDSTTTGPQAGATATHVYAAEGSYTVSVTVTDSGSRTGTASSASVTVKTSSLFGSNVDATTRVACSNPGVGNCRASDSTRPETSTEALARQDTEYAPEVLRIFNSGLPTTNCSDFKNSQNRVTIQSFKAPSQTLFASGSYDTTINAWLACFTTKTYVTEYHEPEDNFTTTQQKADYRAALQHMSDLVLAHPNRANLLRTIIYGDFTWQGTARNPLDWYPGDAYLDAIGADCYNFAEEDSNPSNDQTMAQHQTIRASRAFAVSHSKPYIIPELGYDDPSTRAAFLADVSSWAQANDVAVVTYFDSIGTLGDHRLQDTASQNAWAAAVAT